MDEPSTARRGGAEGAADTAGTAAERRGGSGGGVSGEGTTERAGPGDRNGGWGDTRVRTAGPESPGPLGDAVQWLLLEGPRPVVVALVSAGIFALVVGLGLAGVLQVSRASRVATVFSTTVTGLFTLVTITVSINQLVLSRILGSPEHIEERINSVRAFRESVADESDRVTVAPTEPAAFLEVVTRALRSHARRPDDVFDDRHDPQTEKDVRTLVDELEEIADQVDAGISSHKLALFDVLLPVLGNRYSARIHTLDRIRATTDDLSADQERALIGLRELLVEVNRTRHYFKTLYLHEALSTLSKLILGTGVLAVLVGYVVILSYTVPSGGATPVHLVAVAAALTAALSPLTVLFAYGSRVATIAAQTTTFGTFTPVEELP